MSFISEALNLYGATLSLEGVICKGFVVTGVTPMVDGTRLRFHSSDGRLLGSYPATIEGVCYFVESYWFWRKL